MDGSGDHARTTSIRTSAGSSASVLDQTIDLNGDGELKILPMGLNDVDLDNDPNGPEDCQKPENHTFLTGIDDWSRLRYSRHGLRRLGRG